MTAVLDAAGPLDGEALARVEHAFSQRREPEPFDPVAGRHRLDQLLGLVARSEKAST